MKKKQDEISFDSVRILKEIEIFDGNIDLCIQHYEKVSKILLDTAYVTSGEVCRKNHLMPKNVELLINSLRTQKKIKEVKSIPEDVQNAIKTYGSVEKAIKFYSSWYRRLRNILQLHDRTFSGGCQIYNESVEELKKVTRILCNLEVLKDN